MNIVKIMNKTAPATMLAIKSLGDHAVLGDEYELHVNHPAMSRCLNNTLKMSGFTLLDIDQIGHELIIHVIKE